MNAKNCYFASANSKNGFADFFDEVFGQCEYRYILKGGPGTGKSTLMRRVGEEAEKIGLTVEYILCSSDPGSVDGVIIKERSVCVIDGTAPHAHDVKIAGIDSELINLGSFWSKKKLQKEKDAIINVSKEKSKNYKKAYECMASAYECERVINGITRDAYDEEKSRGYATRLADKYKSKVIGKVHTRLISGVGMQGEITLNSFETETNYRIKPSHNAEYLLLKDIYDAFLGRHHEMYISYLYTDPTVINGIYLPDEKISFTVGNAAGETERLINTDRFVDQLVIRENKNKLAFSKKCIKELNRLRDEYFGKVREAHFKLEEYYKSAMNYNALNRESEKLITKILNT